MPAGRNFGTLPRQVTFSQEPKCGVILTLYLTYSCKIAVTLEPIVQLGRSSRFGIYNRYETWSKLWLKAPSLRMWVWRRRKVFFHKGSVSHLINYKTFLEQPLGWKNSQLFCMGGLGGSLRVHGGASRGPQGPNYSSKSLPYKFCMPVGPIMGGLPRAPWGSKCEFGTTFP